MATPDMYLASASLVTPRKSDPPLALIRMGVRRPCQEFPRSQAAKAEQNSVMRLGTPHCSALAWLQAGMHPL